MEIQVVIGCLLVVLWALLGSCMLVLGILLHKIGTIRKWELEDEQAALRSDQEEVVME